MTAGRPRTTDHNQILEEVLAGRTAKEISERLGICVGQVHKVARIFGASVSLPQRKKNPNEDLIVARVLETGNGYLADKEFHLSRGSSKKICRMLGIDYPQSVGRKKENLTYEQILEKHPNWKGIEKLYLSGKTQAQIGEMLGLSAPSIGFVLQKLGITVGKGAKSRRKKKFLPDSVVQLYESGLSCKEIGLMFGVHRQIVEKRLIQLNIPRRIGKASGSKNPQWKGGRSQTMHRYRRQAYEVAAICLGKPTPEGHVIHHIDENPKNNNPRNLMFFPSAKHHARFHQTAIKNRLPAGSEEAILLALEIGGVPLPEPKIPIEL